MPKANDRQVDGTHYQKGDVQHWDWAKNLPYLEGCATKYIGRHQDKNGLKDIAKGLHFVEKIVEEHYPGVVCRIILEIPPPEGTPINAEGEGENFHVNENPDAPCVCQYEAHTAGSNTWACPKHGQVELAVDIGEATEAYVNQDPPECVCHEVENDSSRMVWDCPEHGVVERSVFKKGLCNCAELAGSWRLGTWDCTVHGPVTRAAYEQAQREVQALGPI